MRLSIPLIREAIRLSNEIQLSCTDAGQLLKISPTSVRKIQRIAAQHELQWQSIKAMSDDDLAAIFCNNTNQTTKQNKAQPDWEEIDTELQKKNMTLMLLWCEWKELVPDGIGYSQFTECYRQWKKRVDITMRQNHIAGEKMFVDFCGHTLPITNPDTGEVKNAQIFVAVLGASNYTFVYAVGSQSISDWIKCHIKAYEFFGGVARFVIPDNLKSAVIKHGKSNIVLNANYVQMLRYYNSIALPARPRRGNDKPKAEIGVQIVQRWILASLRNELFNDISEVNEKIMPLLVKLNNRKFKKIHGTRYSRFLDIEKDTLRTLPDVPYNNALWVFNYLVPRDHHIELHGHFYSIPFHLVNQRINIEYTDNLVLFHFKNKCVASHIRSDTQMESTTDKAHLPVHYQYQKEGEEAELIKWATQAGAATLECIRYHLDERIDFTNGLKAAQAIRKLSRLYGDERIEQVCAYAKHINTFSLNSIRSIIKNDFDKRPRKSTIDTSVLVNHQNVRGPAYFENNKNGN